MRWLLFLLSAAPAIAGPIDFGSLDALPPAEVVVLGEIHDNPVHHANQSRAIAAIGPRAVVWEMIPEGTVVPADVTDADRLAQALQWHERGWPDFSMYHPIFLAAGTARHFGAEIPRDRARLAVRDGAMAAMPDGGRFGLDRPLPPDEQAQREAEQLSAHCDAMPMEMMGGMVAAQRVRDAALARAVLQALDTVGPPVAVITGSGHARRDWGLPAVLAIAAPEVSVLSVGQMESDPGPAAPFDLWLVTEAAERPDPCAAFR